MRLVILYGLITACLSISGEINRNFYFKPDGGETEWTLSHLSDSVAEGIKISGNPEPIAFGNSNALFFNGDGDGIFLENMPLAGLEQFTIEVIFQPVSGGNFEQRFFHCGEIQGDRVLLETRSTKTHWYLDAFMKSAGQQKALIDSSLLHQLDQWYHLAFVIDHGKLQTYVNGNRELESHIDFEALHSGKTSIGVRQNGQSWFKGAIYKIRITPDALTPRDFMYPGSYSLAQHGQLIQEAEQAMLLSTRYMVEKVSTNGGYVWFYTPDLLRRWGEMEAYQTMIWMQGPGTVSMGNVFLDAYNATGNEYYYEAAARAASAIIWGQSSEGGWNYMVDFAGDRSLKQWYNTIGKNGWRLEEFQHYYGNSTFDDDVTSNAARFLLRMYLEKLDPVWKPALDKAIGFILESQYPLGGWPQRYPLKGDFIKAGHPDYTSYYTFNDDVVWENINFLIQCYLTLGEERFLDPIRKGMNFYLISQDSCGGWGQQLDMNLKAAGARTYEPKALLPSTTLENARLLLTFYQYTGDRKFLARIPDAIHWLEKVNLPSDQRGGGSYTHPTFVEMGTNKPLYVHRKGSNVTYGAYYIDDSDDSLLSHYGGKTRIPVDRLKAEYDRISALSPEEATKDSPLRIERFRGNGTPQHFYDLNLNFIPLAVNPDETVVKEIIRSLDQENRWLVKHASISNPYTGDGQKTELTDKFASTNVGDETDTSPYRDTSGKEYLSTWKYIMNMKILINYLKSEKHEPSI